MNNEKMKNITRCGLLIAIMLLIQLLKNLSAFISGPLINIVLIVGTCTVGLWCGIFLSILAPITSIIIAPSSPMTQVTFATSFVNLPVIMIGNIILILFAHFYYKKGGKQYIPFIILGSVLKWLFMWGCADFIIKPLFTQNLGKLVAVINKVFSTLQLYAGVVGGILSYFVLLIINRKHNNETK